MTASLIPLALLASIYVLALFLPWTYSFVKERRYPSCVCANFIMVVAIALIWKGALA